MLILIGTSLQKQLPTIRSRCQSIVFKKLENENLTNLILANDLAETNEAAEVLAANAKGSLARAAQVADPELQQFFADMLPLLVARQLDIVELAKQIGAAVDSVGKEGRLKRERLKLILQFTADFYRAIALDLTETANQPEYVVRATKSWLERRKHDTASALKLWNRCLTAIEEVDRNANQASLLAAWSSDLSLT